MSRLVLTNARLIDGTGTQPREGMTVVIVDGRITEVRSEPAGDAGTPDPMGEEHIHSLNEQEREVLNLRYGLTGERPLTADEVAQRLGISAERLRQIETGILRGMRDVSGLQEQRTPAKADDGEVIDLEGRTLVPGL